MIYYAVIDTNVLISALLSSKDDAATVQVVSRVIDGRITPIYSDTIMDEYRTVLARDKFGFSDKLVQYLLSAIEKYGILVEVQNTQRIRERPRPLSYFRFYLWF